MTYYILPHLGLGDYLVCNGLIRNLIKTDDPYILFTNIKYKTSIEFMFRDIKNLSYSFVPPVEFNRQYIMPYIKHNPHKLITIGYEAIRPNVSADITFYNQHQIPFFKRWSDFYVERDLEREMKLFEQYGVKEHEYIFLHEGGSANDAFIDRSKIETNKPFVSPDPKLTDNIFDYRYLIENAFEVHIIESSFLFLTDSIYTNGKLFAHRYARKLETFSIPHINKPWTILQ